LTKESSNAPANREFPLLPKGEYAADLIDNGLYESDDGREFALLVYRVLSGEFKGSLLAHRIWLANTDKAEAYCNFALRKLGLESLAQLQAPLYPAKHIRCKVTLDIYEPEDGRAPWNNVVRFERVPVEEAPAGFLDSV
jgi:hypothetical protein